MDVASKEDWKRLCWIAWRHGSIGSGASQKDDALAFNQWWNNDAEFLLTQLPIEPHPNYDLKQTV